MVKYLVQGKTTLAAGDNTIYTVPSGKKAKLLSLIVTNTTGTAETITFKDNTTDLFDVYADNNATTTLDRNVLGQEIYTSLVANVTTGGETVGYVIEVTEY